MRRKFFKHNIENLLEELLKLFDKGCLDFDSQRKIRKIIKEIRQELPKNDI